MDLTRLKVHIHETLRIFASGVVPKFWQLITECVDEVHPDEKTSEPGVVKMLDQRIQALDPDGTPRQSESKLPMDSDYQIANHFRALFKIMLVTC